MRDRQARGGGHHRPDLRCLHFGFRWPRGASVRLILIDPFDSEDGGSRRKFAGQARVAAEILDKRDAAGSIDKAASGVRLARGSLWLMAVISEGVRAVKYSLITGRWCRSIGLHAS